MSENEAAGKIRPEDDSFKQEDSSVAGNHSVQPTSKEQTVLQKKPVPKWRGPSTKVKDCPRREAPKTDLNVFFFGSFILKRDLFIFTGIALIILLIVTASSVIWIIDERESRIAAYEGYLSGDSAVEEINNNRPSLKQINIHSLIQWHIAATRAEELYSFQMRGAATMIPEESTIQVSLLGLPPEHYRQDSWTNWEYRISSVISKGEFFHKASDDAVKFQITELEEAILWMETSLFYLAQTYLAEKKALAEKSYEASELGFIKITDFEGNRYAVIESTTPKGYGQLHYIDYKTGLESRRTSRVKSDGKEHEIEVFYLYKDLSQEIEQDKPILPYSYLLKIDGITKYTVTIESTQINLGLTENLFLEN